jgi:hypothetical protein
MTSQKLNNLVKTGGLKAEPGSQPEFDGLLRSGRARLIDARNESLSIESRFDLAYNAAHALSLAALRWHGYRSENRYLVFRYSNTLWALPLKCGVFWQHATTNGILLNTKAILRLTINSLSTSSKPHCYC